MLKQIYERFLWLCNTKHMPDKFRVNKSLRSEGSRVLDFTSEAIGIPVGLTSDLARMVKRGVINEQQARDMMEAKKITPGYIYCSRQSEGFIA